MRFRIRVLITALAISLCVTPTAYANPLKLLYAPVHVHGTSQSQAFIRQHFRTVSVSTGQLKKGFRSSNTGIYTKGTRSNVGTYPESWYMHTAGGARIHDRALGRYFVMNPSSSGWRQQVVKNCAGAPQWCFVDAMGADGYQRMSAKPTVSESWWIQQTIAEATYLENASSRWSVMANNAITANNPNFAVGFEMFGRISAQRSLQVLRHTRCYCFAKFSTESGALYGFTLFLTGAGRGDHISVGSDSQTGKWWRFFARAGRLGDPTGAARSRGSLISRRFAHGVVVVNIGSSSVTTARSVSLAPRTGKIILR